MARNEHGLRYGLLLDRRGAAQAGNMPGLPEGLPLDGTAHEATTVGVDDDDDRFAELVRAVALRLPDGRTLAVGYDTDTDTEQDLRAVLRRALGRVRQFDLALAAVRAGDLSRRLPEAGSRDEFGRLAAVVNAMLAEVEQLVGEIRGVGDSIAHDLRTPLTRARMRLERQRDRVMTRDGFVEAVDEALAWLDQTLAIITAVLRIGGIEHGRRAAFAPVALAPLLREVVEFYDPVAQEGGVRLALAPLAELTVTRDRELLSGAVVNLVDNAIKFTPRGGRVAVSLRKDRVRGAVVKVSDTGPGIAASERALVHRRFYRGERSRHTEGSELGLSLMQAIANLHGHALVIADAAPGCRVALRIPGEPPVPADAWSPAA